MVLGDVDDEELGLRALRGGARGYLLRSELNTRLLVTTLGAAQVSHRTDLQLNSARQRARRREHVRGRGAAIVGTSGDLPSATSEKGRKKVPKPRGNSVAVSDSNLHAVKTGHC